jgi:glycosyltransferase involved in cell wall biosynthesis
MMRAYNAEPFLAEAISSVLGQSYPHFELLVADDASTDRTLEIAQAYALADPRVRVLSGPHRGEIAQANRCLSESRFPWIAVLDSDDVALPDRFLLTMQAAGENPEVVLWGGAAVLIDRHGRAMRRARVGPTSIPEYDRAVASGKVIFVMSPTVMYRKEVALAAGGYDERMTAADDVELMDRVARLGPALCLPSDLALYRVHGSNLSSTRAAHQQLVFDYVDARNQAILRGESLDYDQYIDDLRRQPARRRALRWMRDRGREKYRAAIVHMAERRFVQAGAAAALAVTLDPAHALRRIGNRVLKHSLTKD